MYVTAFVAKLVQVFLLVMHTLPNRHRSDHTSLVMLRKRPCMRLCVCRGGDGSGGDGRRGETGVCATATVSATQRGSV